MNKPLSAKSNDLKASPTFKTRKSPSPAKRDKFSDSSSLLQMKHKQQVSMLREAELLRNEKFINYLNNEVTGGQQRYMRTEEQVASDEEMDGNIPSLFYDGVLKSSREVGLTN
jgi:hypothetical protein